MALQSEVSPTIVGESPNKDTQIDGEKRSSIITKYDSGLSKLSNLGNFLIVGRVWDYFIYNQKYEQC